MTQHYSIGNRYLVIRDVFASGDSADNLIYRPHVDTLTETEYAVIDCVEEHVTHLSLDPTAPADGRSLRFMTGLGEIWNTQYPLWVDTDSRDDHVAMTLVTQRDGAPSTDRPYIHAGYMLGRLEWMLREPNLTPEQIQAIEAYRDGLRTLIYNNGLWNTLPIIDMPPPILVEPEPNPDPELNPPAEEPTP